jgi:hypothetical protein
MAVVYSGGTYINTTFTGGTKTNICNNVETQLVAAGWTTISGTGTTNVLLQSAAAPGSGNQGRVRLKDNGGNCVQVTIENVSGTAVQPSSTTSGGNLLPAASKVFRILASKFRFEVFTPWPTVAREFVMAGIVYVPSAYNGVITEAIYQCCNSCLDGDTTLRNSLRNFPYAGIGSNSCGIVNGNVNNWTNNANTACGSVQVRYMSNSYVTNYNTNNFPGQANLYRWHDLALDVSDVLIGWGLAAASDEALIRGQLFDYCYISDAFAADTTDSWTDQSATHSFFNLTNSYSGTAGASMRGSFWVATS